MVTVSTYWSVLVKVLLIIGGVEAGTPESDTFGNIQEVQEEEKLANSLLNIGGVGSKSAGKWQVRE